jgi:hypothetical protein
MFRRVFYSIVVCFLLGTAVPAQSIPVARGGYGKRMWLEAATYLIQSEPWMISFAQITDSLGGPFGIGFPDGLTLGIKGRTIKPGPVRVEIDGATFKPQKVEWGGMTTFTNEQVWSVWCNGTRYTPTTYCRLSETTRFYPLKGPADQATIRFKLSDLPRISAATHVRFEIAGNTYECQPEHLAAFRQLIAIYEAEKAAKK